MPNIGTKSEEVHTGKRENVSDKPEFSKAFLKTILHGKTVTLLDGFSFALMANHPYFTAVFFPC